MSDDKMKMPKFSEVKYVRPSVEQFRECAEDTRKKLKEAKDPDTVETAIMAFQRAMSAFDTAYTICMIRHDLDTVDQFWNDEMDFFDENYPVISDLSADVYTAMLESEIRDELVERFGDMIFRKIQIQREIVSSEVLDDLADESSLENDYSQILSEADILFQGNHQTISTMTPFLESTDRDVRRKAHKAVSDYYAGQKAKFDEIYDNMVRIRTTIAKKLGFKDFVELGYKRMERYDYDPGKVKEFRDNVVKYIVPITSEIRRLQKNRLELDKLLYYDLPCLFVNGNPTPVIPKEKYFETGSQMFAKMFDKTPSFFQVLGEHDFMDLFSRQNKATGGYCASLLDYGIPYILMNANHTADDVATMVHESGHAYAALRSIDSSQFIECLSPTLEACEIHSTSMEYLTYPFMEMFFGDSADAYRQQHMTLAILFLPYGCLVDEYQHVVYSNPDMTPEERHAAWRELEKKYQPDIDYDGDPFYEAGGAWMKKEHIFTSPFYYIDYCLAQVCALQIWSIARKNRKKAMSIYEHLCAAGGTQTLIDLVESAGLESPFSLDVMKKLAYQVCDYLDL
ncbi:MAG: M3 family oligoendopeptidase [Clostridiales bacterium]|nr:M3 family oligoendopeptidase [Clostridiales bacterium]